MHTAAQDPVYNASFQLPVSGEVKHLSGSELYQLPPHLSVYVLCPDVLTESSHRVPLHMNEVEVSNHAIPMIIPFHSG